MISDVSAILSIAGTWQPVDSRYITAKYSGQLANTFYGILPLGSGNSNGFVITGWAFQGQFGGTQSVAPVNAAFFSEKSDGTLSLTTSQFVSDSTTNGGGSVVIADFNGDGRPDIFLAAHNESPFVSEPSTAYLSNGLGGFNKITLNDSVQAHDATLAVINGIPTVITTTFSDPRNPIYTWNGNSFTETAEPPNPQAVGAMSVAAADFNGDGRSEIVFGEAAFGPGFSYVPNAAGTFVLWDLQNSELIGSPHFIGTPYFNNKSQYANLQSSIASAQPTHTYRIWVDDFNHDGKPDILASESVWSETLGPQVSMLQMFQNKGNLQFSDVTDRFNPSYQQQTAEIDYTMQLVDLDHSGINSYLSASHSVFNNQTQQWQPSYQNNFLLMNDGTGHLYYALHDQFVQWGQQVVAYVNSHTAGLRYPVNAGSIPSFIGYETTNGLLNFTAEVEIGVDVGGILTTQYEFVNIPTQFNVDTLITSSITITDRNGSHLIRTFSGNDIIYSGNDGGFAHVDGGSGVDTIVYRGLRSSYSINSQPNGSVVVSDTISNRDGIDTLINVERLQFSDSVLALDGQGNAGNAYRLYQAAFNRTPDTGGLSYWTHGLDIGIDIQTISQGFVNSAEFRQVYGSSPTNAHIIDLFYQNVLGRAGEPSGISYWQGVLNRGVSIAEVLQGFAGSPENHSHVDPIIAQGISLDRSAFLV
jgi:hypothetical protein